MPTLDQHSTTRRRGTLWASVWYAVSLGAWLASWGMKPLGESSAASLASLAIFTELLSVAVRWKWISKSGSYLPASPDKTAAEFAWLCAWGGQANALGFASMLAPNLASMLPGVLVTAVLEVLLLPKAPFALKAIGQTVAEEVLPAAASPTAPPTIELAAPDSDNPHWTRSTQEGRAETGERFLSGWVRFALAVDQKAITLTIGFSPAFLTPPEVELDQEVDSEDSHCEALVEQVTPAGMRVAIKRTASGEPLAGKLLWHASEADRSPSLLSTRLP